MAALSPDRQRRFAVKLVRVLHEAGYDAYWAGGCVRDRLLGREPNDYDVATSATPEAIRRIFGRRRTLAIGAAFGVITVLGPPGAGQFEVATFRSDSEYGDGRHPDSVTYSSAKEDALRRDFTINGLFFDPLTETVIDYVGGREDIRRGVVRAIGQAQARFNEDKLRMIRAVRFAANFGFTLDAETEAAIAQMADQVTVVSVERIAGEMRRMLTGPGRVVAVRLLLQTGLAKSILPEIIQTEDAVRLERALAVLERFDSPSFPLALAGLLREFAGVEGALDVCRRWKLSNDDTRRIAWLIGSFGVLPQAAQTRWSVLQKYLVADGIEELLTLETAVALELKQPLDFVDICREKLAQPRQRLDPDPLLTGNDLIEHGVQTGPAYKHLLDRVRAAQLDREIETKREALAYVDRLIESKALRKDT